MDDHAGAQSVRPIVVVDDEPFVLRSLAYLLTKEGYDVQTATNGEEGLALVKSTKPPIVFLDVMMPKLNGYEVCRRIRQDGDLSSTCIVLLSAKGQQVDRELGLRNGADRYMTKPFSPREVALWVHNTMDGESADRGDMRLAG
jgi:two-component system, OmpR family, alkaline phosphatase synthesis response regulator PhoP